jgi:hypothetical protein
MEAASGPSLWWPNSPRLAPTSRAQAQLGQALEPRSIRQDPELHSPLQRENRERKAAYLLWCLPLSISGLFWRRGLGTGPVSGGGYADTVDGGGGGGRGEGGGGV